MDTALVIMAAGMGTRFGGGIKQLEPVGPCGEIIMDYSIHDAIEAGFNKVVFIIRKNLEENFQNIIGKRIEKICADRNVSVAYAFQEVENLPEGFEKGDREKPWGTGQAVLACKGIVNEPFVVINADDYYGKEAFIKIHSFLEKYTPDKPFNYCMAGFILGNTLSDNGGVTRGVCEVDENGYLSNIIETSNIEKVGEGAGIKDGDKVVETIDIKTNVSMNMWGLTPQFIDILDDGFKNFLANLKDGDIKSEYLLPTIIGDLLNEGKVTVKVLETPDRWFGVTYKEDKQTVVDAFKALTDAGVYSPQLF